MTYSLFIKKKAYVKGQHLLNSSMAVLFGALN